MPASAGGGLTPILWGIQALGDAAFQLLSRFVHFGTRAGDNCDIGKPILLYVHLPVATTSGYRRVAEWTPEHGAQLAGPGSLGPSGPASKLRDVRSLQVSDTVALVPDPRPSPRRHQLTIDTATLPEIEGYYESRRPPRASGSPDALRGSATR